MPETRQQRKLTKEEFELLLQRAVERQEFRESVAFTVDELVEAGHELGIDAETVREVYGEHAQDLARGPGRPKPSGSKLQLATDGATLRLTIPPEIATQVTAALQTAMLAGIAAWLFRRGSPALLMAAAVAVAAAFGYFRLRAAWSIRELRLRRDGGGLLIRFRGGEGKGIPLEPGQVHVRLAERTVEGKYTSRRVSFVSLDHGTESYELLEGYSHAEQVWTVNEIERWLGQSPVT